MRELSPTWNAVRTHAWVAVLLGIAPTLAPAQGGASPTMLDDRREVLITGIGGVAPSGEEPARVSVVLNGVEFAVLTEFASNSEGDGIQSPMRTCKQLAEQIAGFAVEMLSLIHISSPRDS